jgi:hypothetical protein
MAFRSTFLRLLAVCFLLPPGAMAADTAAFDLPGPRVEVRVNRGGKELPIGDVPDLQVGDRLWVHPDLPDSQSAHYLLIVTFLRGSTNPPPEDWFIRIETWNKHVKQEGVMVTVPKGAEQALMFLAPETGGDFGTLRSNVRGRPGAFVRASQDLNRAALDRTRLDLYLKDVKQISTDDPDKLKEQSTLLARSLGIKVDSDCFKKPVDEQETCLTQNSTQLVLDDPHSQSMAAQLASGPGADLVGQISATPLAGAGYYSAYVGAVVDVVRIMTSFHTADYQYIPALALPKDDQLNLQLNAPPSFQKPKSVLVIGLPSIEAPQLPPLHPIDPKGVYCLQSTSLVLPVQGAPLAFSTTLGHDWVLHAYSKSGGSLDIPVKAVASEGGFVIDSHPRRSDNMENNPPPPTEADLAKLGPEVSGTLRGRWGFDAFEGPTFHLRTARSTDWALLPADQTALITGRYDTVHLKSDQAACVDEVTVQDAQGKKLKTTHKVTKPDELQVDVALKDVAPGPLTMQVKQSGLSKPDEVSLHTYAEAGHLDSFTIDAGDRQGMLRGTRLDEVASLELNGLQFAPGALNRAGNEDELPMSALASADVSALQAGSTTTSHATLKDGRVLSVTTVVQTQRPRVTLISKSVQPDASAAASAIQLQGGGELPQSATLTFALKSEKPATFPHDEMIEVATEDESVHVMLSVSDGTLTMQDAQTVLALLDPRKNLGASAFGPLRFRPVNANGEKGDWQPLVTLVRLPTLEALHCPASAEQACTLQGSGLYLIDSVSNDPQFQQSMPVPDGFAGSSLDVPHPNGRVLYVKLRDDRSTVNKLDLPVTPQP